MSFTREQLAQQIVDAGRFLYGRGWSPATSSNYSTRLSASEALLTGRQQKGSWDWTMYCHACPVPAWSRAKTVANLCPPSSQLAPEIGALRNPLVNARVLSRLTPQDFIDFEDYETAKGLQRYLDPRIPGARPIFDNDQDIGALATGAPGSTPIPIARYMIRVTALHLGCADDDALRQIEALIPLIAS